MPAPMAMPKAEPGPIRFELSEPVPQPFRPEHVLAGSDQWAVSEGHPGGFSNAGAVRLPHKTLGVLPRVAVNGRHSRWATTPFSANVSSTFPVLSGITVRDAVGIATAVI